VGPLFQGRFQAKLVATDGYLLHLSRYIHINPVKAGLVKESASWHYSSYPEYISNRKGTLPCTDFILSMFQDSPNLNKELAHARYKDFVESYRDEDIYQIKHLLF
jgi:hypothetical protein